jgi:hypothetical protein
MTKANRRAAALAALLLATGGSFGMSACGEEETPAAQAPKAAVKHVTEKDYAKATFSKPTKIDNKWFPLPAGTEYVFEGRSNRGKGQRPHRVIFTVTDLTKVIDGVRTRVMWDRDINDGELLEAELAFFAQDDAGNVWAFGEYPEEYDGGKFEGAPDTWIVGRAGTKAGVHMRATPRPGTSSYAQGVAPAIGFGDRAKVQKVGQRACVPVGCYDNVLVTDETNPLEPNDGHQLKFYAPGVGVIRAAPGVGGKEREVLDLVKVRKLGPQALAHVRREALKLDRRAYRAAKVYRGTPPAQRDG